MKTIAKNLLTATLAALEPAASAFAWICISARARREDARHLKRWNTAR